MKRIYLGTLISLFIVLSAIGVLVQINSEKYFYSWYAFVQQKKDISLGEIKIVPPETLALGNSQMQSAFMALQLENSFNLAYPGTSIIENYYLLKKYLENNQAPKTILYGLFPQNNYLYFFNFWNLHIRYGAYTISEIFSIYIDTVKTNNFLMIEQSSNIFTDSLRFFYSAMAFKFNFPAYYQQDIFSIIENRPIMIDYKGYQEKSLQEKGFYSFSTPPHINETIRLRLIKERQSRGNTFTQEPILQLYWNKFMDLLIKHDISLIYFHMPNHSNLAHAIGENVAKGSESYYKEYFSKYPKTYFIETIELEDKDYLDIQHYTRAGADKFTKKLIEKIKEIKK